MSSLKEQIELARKAMEQWPQWMKDTAHFEGMEHPKYPDPPECRHCGGLAGRCGC